MNLGLQQKLYYSVFIHGIIGMLDGAVSTQIDVMGRGNTSRWVLLRAWHWQPIPHISLSSKFLISAVTQLCPPS